MGTFNCLKCKEDFENPELDIVFLGKKRKYVYICPLCNSVLIYKKDIKLKFEPLE